MFDFERFIGIIADIIVLIIATLLLVSYIEVRKEEKAQATVDDEKRADNIEREYESVSSEVEELSEKIENMSNTELGSREGRRLMLRHDNLAMVADLLNTALRYSQKEIEENENMYKNMCEAESETV